MVSTAPPRNLRREREAAARRAAIDQHRAGAADAVLAAEMRAGQFQLLAQEVGEMLARLDAPLERPAIQRRFDGDVFLADLDIGFVGHAVATFDRELSTRRVSTVAICSLVSARSPGVSSGVRSVRIAASNADASASGTALPGNRRGDRRRELGAVDAAEIDEPRGRRCGHAAGAQPPQARPARSRRAGATARQSQSTCPPVSPETSPRRSARQAADRSRTGP